MIGVLQPGRNLVLAGLMGTGKTTVGRLLAERLARPFVDTDALIEQEAGLRIAEIFATEGERGFRAREAEVIRRVAASRGQVLAVGGGAVLAASNVTFLRGNGDIVVLEATPATLAARLDEDAVTERPLLAESGDHLERLAALQRGRREAYLRAAAHSVDTTAQDPEETAAAVLDWARHQPGLLAAEERVS